MFSFSKLAAKHHSRRITFLVPFVMLFNAAQAQTNITTHHPLITLSSEDKVRGLNGPQANFYFALDDSNDYQNAGFFGQRLRPYLAGNTEALNYLNDYRRQKTLLIGERLVFVGAVAAYGQQVLAGDQQVYFNTKQQVIIGVAAASLLANVFISRNTNRYFQRAVEEYNSGLPTSYHNMLRRLAPTAVGLTAPTGQPQLAIRWSLR
ncbi:hypothetical protein [Hymenobacter crusticola]|uniref:DUF5683 domain-containing protein n=1 Tax=Hymenobacter crusticola TaxID=1770526 RepID=A0A243WHW7_9BACT|nr:hypothetical protein [Hymenobacter crusticola]OUJ75163.1 hypothetical protein BXP70_03820 [Hymenobacter crusticola]